MDPCRINILGASGVGKTTLGRALSERLGIPHLDSDDYYHLPTDPPYQVPRSPEERRALLERDLAKADSWVLGGGAAAWDPPPVLRCTLHVFLTLPRDARIRRLALREHTLYGDRIRPGGDMVALHRAFMDWTEGYDASTSEGTNTLACHEGLLARAMCPVLRLAGPMSLDDAVERVVSRLRAASPPRGR